MRTIYGLGDAYRATRRWEEAAREYEMALALRPELEQGGLVSLVSKKGLSDEWSGGESPQGV